MKKQNIFSNKAIASFWSMLVLMMFSQSLLFGQNTTYEAGAYLVNDGNFHDFSADAKTRGKNYLDFKIHNDPEFDANYKYIMISLKGGDGGKAEKGEQIGGGGIGATMTAIFPIGDGLSDLKKGSTLRFIVGKKGNNHEWGAGGGGGSSVLYSEDGSTNWQVLAVAGGGGGGVIYQNSVAHKSGYSGQGGIWKPNEAGDSFTYVLGGGGRSDKAGVDYFGGSGNPGIGSDGIPDGGIGGHDGSNGGDGGFGFGSGGGGVQESHTFNASGRGGGGGGYTGGPRGGYGEAGKGGYSYLDARVVKYYSTANLGGDNSPIDGYASYRFITSLDPVQARDARIIQQYASPNKCIDNSAGSLNNKNNIQLWSCQEGNNNQVWQYDGVRMTIRLNSHPDKCLDILDNKTNNGQNIQLYGCSGWDNQSWIYDGLTLQFRSKRDLNKCLDVAGGGTADGTNIQLWDCMDGNPNQQFIMK